MFDFKNFSNRSFIDYVMQKMHLENSDEITKRKFEKEIARILGNRIITTVMNSMTDDNLFEFDVLKTQNPELADMEVLFLYAKRVPALEEALTKSVNDLADELTQDAERIDEVINEKNQNINK